MFFLQILMSPSKFRQEGQNTFCPSNILCKRCRFTYRMFEFFVTFLKIFGSLCSPLHFYCFFSLIKTFTKIKRKNYLLAELAIALILFWSHPCKILAIASNFVPLNIENKMKSLVCSMKLNIKKNFIQPKGNKPKVELSS